MTQNTDQRDRGQVTGNIRDFLLAADELPSPRGAALQLMFRYPGDAALAAGQGHHRL